jgi:hypothetical protein
MTGTELETFCGEINGGAFIGPTMLFQFLNLAKAMVEQLRPWMLLRYTDTSVTTIDLSGIPRFNRFYGETPIKLFNGANGIQYFKQVRSTGVSSTAALPARSSTTRRARRSTSTARCSPPARSTSTTSRTAPTSRTTMARRGYSRAGRIPCSDSTRSASIRAASITTASTRAWRPNRALAKVITDRLEWLDNEKQPRPEEH